MKITYLNSASILIEDAGVKILCDPWLYGNEYFGSWGIYPPYDFRPEKFQDVDFIYISHIHPDHCSAKTLSKLDKKIPVLIHDFPEKFLKSYLSGMGFSVIELQHNMRTKLKDNLHINILAADNCNPEICGKLMGCAVLEKNFGTTQIDTMAVIDNGTQVILNTNDCPFPIAEQTAIKVKSQYQNIDFLLVGYVKASSYPQCFDLEEDVKLKEAKLKQEKKLATVIQYVNLLKPKYYMPFAGRYTLTGKNTKLNQYRGEPELEHAIEYLSQKIPHSQSKCIALNHDESFDVTAGKQSKPFVPVDFNKKKEYVENVFSKTSYDYETLPFPETEELLKLIPKCYENFEKTRKRINWHSETTIALRIDTDTYVAISCNGVGYKIISENDLQNLNHVLVMKVDSRLLKWILQGPRKAHWSLADIGCHIRYKRTPNVYERSLYYCWNDFYSDDYQNLQKTS